MMECGRARRSGVLLCLVLVSAFQGEARSLGRQDRQDISPTLDPESSKKFFKKDYPSDGRPGVDVLHFKHPYPVVQDSGEFDSDYVKDENSDNGHWSAQQEYDRLRHKLTKEKKEAAKALDKKREEEKELKNALDKYQKEMQDNQARAAKKKAEVVKKKEQEKQEQEKPAKENNDQGWSWSWDWWPFSWPKWNVPESKPAPKAVEKGPGLEDATKDTKNAMENLEDCQKELAKARAELEKLMDELEKAKAKQAEADAVVEAATQKQLEAQKLADGLHDKTAEEKAEHDSAEAAYLKQKAVVDKLEADLEAAAAKVKAYRDAEDRGGGVYNTPTKSLTIPFSSPQVLILLLAAGATWQFA